MFGWVVELFKKKDTIKCRLCKKQKLKSEMFHDAAYGYFCTEDEFNKMWLRNQV
jgi:hypothetical protein